MLRVNQRVFHPMPSLSVGSQDDICGCDELWRGSGQGTFHESQETGRLPSWPAHPPCITSVPGVGVTL